MAGFDRFGRHDEISQSAAGQLLLTELNCSACHTSNNKQFTPKQGPVLDHVGSRVQSAWLKQYLTNPSKVKPGTTMPDALANVPASIKQNVVDALVAFLETQAAPFPEIKATGANPVPFQFWTKGNAEIGSEVYHKTGCVACHQADSEYDVVAVKPSSLDQILEQLDPEEIEEMGLASAARQVNSVPHGNLPAKYTLQSLTYFLLKPDGIRTGGRMPNFNLKAMEAAHLASYLMSKQSDEQPQDKSESNENNAEDHNRLVADGRRWFTSLGCANCHAIKNLKPQQSAKPLNEIDIDSATACYETPGKPIWQPRFVIDDSQKQALKAAITSWHNQSTTADKHQLDSQLLALNCYACHQREKLGGIGRYRKPYFETVGHVDIGDEGRLPPELTNVGQKMKPAWLNDVIAGKARVRSHMHVRMPTFPAQQVKPLPGLFVKVDEGTSQPSEKTVFAVLESKQADLKELQAAGRKLMDVGCVQCHSFRGEALPGTVGIDLQGIAKRVNPQWFRSFLLDPGSLKQRTRMPTFFPNGQSQYKDLLDGNVDQQIAAMWAYLKDLDRQPLPAKIVEARAQDYELSPNERPIILRTFMKQAGTHAIAVGFPEKVHFAFDAELIRPAVAWRGKFLDAEGTWFIRFAPPANPLGSDVVKLPEGPSLAILESATTPWPATSEEAQAQFSGYRIDKAGTPTFLYTIGSFHVEDTILPSEKQRLKRTLTITGSKEADTTGQLWLRLLNSKKITPTKPNIAKGKNRLQVQLLTPDAGKTQLRDHNTQQEWLLELPTADEQTIELEYQW